MVLSAQLLYRHILLILLKSAENMLFGRTLFH